ncbi:MAG: RloB family protein [Alphaproteobacteria bacterium]|jgi:hypothetical protein|nr:RloB family protein [Alphaproteobacteria bacterium]
MNRSRNKANIDKKKIIVVISEDKKSSYYYLESFRGHYKINSKNFRIIPSDNIGDISGLYNKIKGHEEKNSYRGDEYYIIVDQEDCDIAKVKSYNNKYEDANLIFSIPCFEYFVLLHYKKSNTQFENWQKIAKDLEKEKDFKSKYKKYEKANKKFFQDLAKDFNKVNTNYIFNDYEHPSTKIPEFLNQIVKYKQQDLL